MPGMSPGTPPNIFFGRLHEFLTCRAASRMLEDRIIDTDSAKFFEELSLKCVLRTLASGGFEVWQIQLLFQELPNLLVLKYPVVNDIKNACIRLLPELMQMSRIRNEWRRYSQYDYLLQLLKGMN